MTTIFPLYRSSCSYTARNLQTSYPVIYEEAIKVLSHIKEDYKYIYYNYYYEMTIRLFLVKRWHGMVSLSVAQYFIWNKQAREWVAWH